MEQEVIKPYHLFKHQGGWQVINIEGMFASTIDEAMAGVLKAIAAEPNAPLESQMEEQLKLVIFCTRTELNPDHRNS